MNKQAQAKQKIRLRTKRKIRAKIVGTPIKPRLSIFRSARHMYVQAIDDQTGKTLASASTLSKDLKKKAKKPTGNKESAALVGVQIAKKLQSLKINQAVFDRNGYLYHGRVQEVATAARETGLKI